MHRFFIEPSAVNEAEKKVIIRGRDENHIKNVLRMREGEELDACEGSSGRYYRCIIDRISEDGVECKLCFVKEADTELPVRVYLFQGLPKSDKMELIIQKAVELGVCEVIPVACARSVVRLDEKKASKKRERWQQIARSAAEQSKRAYIPEVKEPMSFKEAVAYASEKAELRLAAYELMKDEGGRMEDTRAIFDAISPGDTVAVFIGPEGGFEESEIDACKSSGVRPITLGRRILRTETAGLTVLSWIILKTEE